MSPQPPKKGQPQQPQKGGGGWKQVPQPQPQPQKKKAPPQPPAPLQLAKPKGSKEIHFACPACGRPIGMPGRALGRKARCSCGCRMIVPTPGGVPRALWMPPEEQVKKAAQQWKTQEPGDGQNASEIALETSPAKMAMYGGVVVAGVIGFIIWKQKQEAANAPKPFVPPTEVAAPDAPKEMAPGEIANVCRQTVFTVEASDAQGAAIAKGPAFLAAKNIVATSFTRVLGASVVRFRGDDGSQWQALNIVAFDAAADVVLFEIPGSERAPIGPDDAAITDPGSSAWIGWPIKEPASAAFAKPARPGTLRMNRACVPGAPILNSKGKLLGMATAAPRGEPEGIPAKSIAALAEKKKGLGIAETLSIESGGPNKGDAVTIGRLLALGRTATAIRLLEAEVASGAGGDSLVWLGEALLIERRPRAAALRFAAVKDSWTARRGEGIAHLDAGNPARALAAFRAAAASGGSDDAGVLAGMSLALARVGATARATAAAESALNAKDADRRALVSVAVAGATAKSEAIEKKALEAFDRTKPTDAESHQARGECALARGDAAAAEKSFAAAKEAGGGSRALAARGRALQQLGQKDAAEEAWSEAARLSPLDEEACLGAAAALEAGGKTDRAYAALSALLAADPASAAANAEAGRILVAKEPAKALPHLEQAAKSAPESAEAARLLARGHVAAGDRAAAEGALAAFLAKHADDEARIDLALLQAVSAPQKSASTLNEVRATDGAVAARAAHARGMALLALNKASEARGAWELAVSLDPSSGLYRYQRAVAAESGDLHESRAVWESYVGWAKKNADDPVRLQAAERRLLERFGR